MDTDRAQMSRPAPRKDGAYPHKELTEKIIGAAYVVHRELGVGFLEKVYETALVQELEERGVRVSSQAEIAVRYKGQPVGVYYADLLVGGKVICEIKAVEGLSSAHEAQLIHYLKAAGIKVGLLLNFGAKRLEIKRRVF
jgi:GxxExxY protein